MEDTIVELKEFWGRVDAEIARFDLLQHPFYQAWSAGELTAEDLKFYAQQYYHQVSQFPTYLTTLHARLPEGAVRREVLANAHDEECVGCSHSELWLRFLQGMGGNANELNEQARLPEISNLVNTFRSLAQQAPVAAVFGALFAYESQVPRIASEKLNGLKKHYGADAATCSYFTLHQKADVLHSNVWREIISGLVRQDATQTEHVLGGVLQAAHALWVALDGIERERLQRGCARGSAVLN